MPRTLHLNLVEQLDPVAFARRHLDFFPDAPQIALMRTKAWRVSVNCARQWGKSSCMAIVALHRALTKPNYLVVILTPGARQSSLFVGKVRRNLRRLGLPVKGDGENEISVKLPNGSVIVGLPNSEEKIRGFSAVGLLIVDEAARVEDSVFHSLKPSLDMGGNLHQGGDLVFLSTPAGKQGFFWEAWSNGDPEWLRVSVPASACSRYHAKTLAEHQRDLGDRLFRQEYCCEFLDTEDGAFREDWIEAAVREDTLPLGQEMLYPGRRIVDGSRHFFIGIDLGNLQDFTALAVLERVTYYWPAERDPATYQFRTQTYHRLRLLERLPKDIGYDAIVRRIRDFCQIPELDKRSTVVVDASGVGAPVVESLRKILLGVPLVSVTITSGRKAHSDELGWKTPRVELLESLGLLLERREIHIAKTMIGLEELKQELRNLKRYVKNSGLVQVDPARSKVHDDLAIAVALAAWQARASTAALERLWSPPPPPAYAHR